MGCNTNLFICLILILISFINCEFNFNTTECINQRNIWKNKINLDLLFQNSPVLFQNYVKDITHLNIEQYLTNSKLLLKHDTKSNILISFYTANIINKELILYRTSSNSHSGTNHDNNNISNIKELEIYVKGTNKLNQNLDNIKESISNIFENNRNRNNNIKCMNEEMIKVLSSSSSSTLNTFDNKMSIYNNDNPLWPSSNSLKDTDITKCITCTVTMGLLSPILLNYLIGDGFYHWCLNHTSNDEATCSTLAIDVALAMELPIIFVSAIITMEVCIYPFCVGDSNDDINSNDSSNIYDKKKFLL